MSAIQAIQITKTFGQGRNRFEALQPTSFAIEQGEFVAIIGPSGSGKSTLLTIMGGLQQPDTGEVTINGHPFSTESERKRGKIRFNDIGFVLQSSNLVPFLTVLDQLQLINIVQKESFNKHQAESLLEQLNILHLKDKYPKELSGGERQRVAIAKALFNRPSIILADEPTASLDTQNAFDVVQILSKQAKNGKKAVIMVTHDQRLIDACDKVYYMEDGNLRLERGVDIHALNQLHEEFPIDDN
ncbi:ABC transporter ATP-binding protein [Aerococcus agrisoli]|uniref:Putative hemin import ATP-binding protein HrtA n=1 Tax=Aerococcus agrisoli TaxID=2487350 RepID=A0A3N4GHY6_9LACT|nr:ABC transporter ATP-binding protein [Aerococcus agrisoli]RPA61318.1 ABC transporter ATP-binding protein [Aerococcus agrisoli]